jgi:hypothetical protein
MFHVFISKNVKWPLSALSDGSRDSARATESAYALTSMRIARGHLAEYLGLKANKRPFLRGIMAGSAVLVRCGLGGIFMYFTSPTPINNERTHPLVHKNHDWSRWSAREGAALQRADVDQTLIIFPEGLDSGLRDTAYDPDPESCPLVTVAKENVNSKHRGTGGIPHDSKINPHSLQPSRTLPHPGLHNSPFALPWQVLSSDLSPTSFSRPEPLSTRPLLT